MAVWNGFEPGFAEFMQRASDKGWPTTKAHEAWWWLTARRDGRPRLSAYDRRMQKALTDDTRRSEAASNAEMARALTELERGRSRV